jgi:hypothetical protein
LIDAILVFAAVTADAAKLNQSTTQLSHCHQNVLIIAFRVVSELILAKATSNLVHQTDVHGVVVFCNTVEEIAVSK